MSQTVENTRSCNAKNPSKKFPDRDPNGYDFQNLISFSLSTDTSPEIVMEI